MAQFCPPTKNPWNPFTTHGTPSKKLPSVNSHHNVGQEVQLPAPPPALAARPGRRLAERGKGGRGSF
jgi:hypothetical protein